MRKREELLIKMIQYGFEDEIKKEVDPDLVHWLNGSKEYEQCVDLCGKCAEELCTDGVEIDGGWEYGHESDSFASCEKCGKLLYCATLSERIDEFPPLLDSFCEIFCLQCYIRGKGEDEELIEYLKKVRMPRKLWKLGKENLKKNEVNYEQI